MSVAPPSSFRDPFAPPSKPLPPPPPEPLQKKPIFWILVGIAALVVVAGSAVLTVVLWPKKVLPLPYDPARLPDSARSVRRYKHDTSQPKEVIASSMATLCGGLDVLRLSMETERPYVNELLADAIAAKDETQKTLQCGAGIAKSFGDGTRYMLSVGDEKKSHIAYVYPLAMDAMPAAGKGVAFSAGPKSLTSIGCVLDDPKGTCADNAWAFAKIPSTTLWLEGRLTDLDAIGSAYAAPHATDQTRELAELATHFDGYETVVLGWGSSALFVKAFGAVDDYSEETRTPHKAFTKSLEAANAVFGIGESVHLREGDHDRLELSMKREEDATDVAKALKELRLALKHAKDRDFHGDETRTERKAREAEAAMYKRAIGDAEVEQKGSMVILDMTLKPEPDEKTAFAERDKDFADRMKRGVDLYKALLKGEKPSDDLIQLIGGRDLAHVVADRKGGPPEAHVDGGSFEVPTVKGLMLPTGFDPSIKSSYVYKNGDTAVVDDVVSRLHAAGWSLRLKAFLGGPTFECVKDDQVVDVWASFGKHEIEIHVVPE